MKQSYTYTDLLLQKTGLLKRMQMIYGIGIAVFIILVAITPFTTSTIIFFALAFVCGWQFIKLKDELTLIKSKVNAEGLIHD